MKAKNPKYLHINNHINSALHHFTTHPIMDSWFTMTNIQTWISKIVVEQKAGLQHTSASALTKSQFLYG